MATKKTARTAKPQQKDLLTRLADAGEEAIARLPDFPGGQRFVEATHALRDRLDELQQRIRSLDPLERRVTELERRLEALEGTGKPAARARTTRSTAAAGATPGARKAGAAVAKSGTAAKRTPSTRSKKSAG
jgi:hypothetical protein